MSKGEKALISLLKKELTTNYKYLLFGFVFFALYAFIFASNGPGVFMLCFVLLFYSISATNLLLDERYKMDLLLGTFPICRKPSWQANTFWSSLSFWEALSSIRPCRLPPGGGYEDSPYWILRAR